MSLFNKLKKKKNKLSFQEAFRLNLKYISQTEMNVKDIEKQFIKNNNHFYLTIGEINCPTGKIIVSDPLAYLPSGRFSPVLDKTIPIGTYPVQIAIYRNESIGIRMCTAKLKIKKTNAVKYECARSTSESASFKAKDGDLSGFPVDAGMISFCDERVALEYQNFLEEWYKENSDKNHYDDYFASFFNESYHLFPQYQREGGDFIEWTNPNSHHKMVMIASGLGDGFYQSFWGYDDDNEICELIVPMVNPDFFEK